MGGEVLHPLGPRPDHPLRPSVGGPRRARLLLGDQVRLPTRRGALRRAALPDAEDGVGRRPGPARVPRAGVGRPGAGREARRAVRHGRDRPAGRRLRPRRPAARQPARHAGGAPPAHRLRRHVRPPPQVARLDRGRPPRTTSRRSALGPTGDHTSTTSPPGSSTRPSPPSPSTRACGGGSTVPATSACCCAGPTTTTTSAPTRSAS